MTPFIVCISLYRTVKLHLYVCWYYGLRLSNLIKETTYLLTYYQYCSYTETTKLDKLLMFFIFRGAKFDLKNRNVTVSCGAQHISI